MARRLVDGTQHVGLASLALIAACAGPTASQPPHDAGLHTVTDAGTFECPSAMVLAPHPVSPFCIDAHEATVGAFRALLPWVAPDAGLPAFCATKIWPDLHLPPADAGKEQVAMSYIDACDAFAFCARSGKRLCGKIGGGTVPQAWESLHDAGVSEWFFACTAGGTRRFPYGDAYDADACHIENSAAPRDVGSSPSCEGGFPGIFDLSGNVWEFEDACVAYTVGGDVFGRCELRGGGTQAGFGYSDGNAACAASGTVLFDTWYPAHARTETVGVRCCADARAR